MCLNTECSDEKREITFLNDEKNRECQEGLVKNKHIYCKEVKMPVYC